MIKKTLTILSLTSLSSLAMAEAPSYNLLSAAYTHDTIGVVGQNINFDGYALGGSFEFADRFFASASYASSSTDDAGLDTDITGWSLGLGYILTESDSTNTYVSLTTIDAEIKDPAIGNEDATALDLSLGIRSFIAEDVEVSAELSYIDGENDDTSISTAVGADLYLSPDWSVGVGINLSEGDFGWGVGTSYHF